MARRNRVEKTLMVYGTVTAILSGINIVRYVFFAQSVPFLVQTMVATFMLACTWFVCAIRIPALALLPGIGCVILHSCSNMFGYTNNIIYLLMAASAIVTAIVGTVFQIKDKTKWNRKSLVSLVSMTLIAVIGGGLWAGNILTVRNQTGMARNEVWAVPAKYDSVACPEPGTVTLFEYETKAYATDSRKVTKQAYVYLPYGYDPEGQYDILYLMHGTGDDEAYWLNKFEYNKTMIDNLIYYGDIRPVIVVTPTWYTEDDLPDDPDKLTYEFVHELRNDLIPAVESTFATYAESVDETGLTGSRQHRAFAGLSRGSATMFRSAYCGSMDYFSKFGAFSACMTTIEEFSVAREPWAEYPIDYLYNTSGTFDFLLDEHIHNTDALLDYEKRLVEQVNFSFDIFPMAYHSMNSWHMALYNCLQIFYSN